MDSFLLNLSSYPTAIYSVALVVVIGYWLLAMLGTFDLDVLDADIDLDLDGDVGEIGRFAGLMTTLGFTGVPVTIVISLLVLNGWIVCYFLSVLVPDFPQFIFIIQLVIETGIAIGSFMIAIPVTATMIKPMKGLFVSLNQGPKSRSLLGVSCQVRSSRLDQGFGEVECQHDGASLIIKARSIGEAKFATGDTVVLVEHMADTDTFNVVSEKEFKQQFE